MEGYHIKLPIYQLIELLGKEANNVVDDAQKVTKGDLMRYQRLSTRDSQKTLNQVWEDYSHMKFGFKIMLERASACITPSTTWESRAHIESIE